MTATAALGRARRSGARFRSLATRRLVRAGKRAGVLRVRPAVLMYHRIATEPVDPWGLAVPPDRFDEQVRWLTRHRTVLPLVEFARVLRAGRLSADAVAITVDDGYACNATTAAPILEEHRAPATFFVTTGPMEAGDEFWWDQLQRIVLDSSAERLELTIEPRTMVVELGEPSVDPVRWGPRAAPSSRRQQAYMELWHAVRGLEPTVQAAAMTDLRSQARVPSAARESHRPMTLEELRALGRSDVVDIGCHTLTHPSLPLQAQPVQRAEIEAARRTCGEIIGRLPVTFAYPFGDYDPSIIELVRDTGYEAACTTDETGVRPGGDVMALPRLQVMDWSADQLARRLRVL